MNLLSMPVWTILALCLSSLALLIAFLNFRRKSSLKLRATYSWTSSSIDCDDQHISSLTIENLKDRAVTIFSIYLRIGHNYYIEIEEFEDKPLVLRAFETWHEEYGPIDFYGVNARRIAMNALFHDKRARKRIVLSTSDGKYVITKPTKVWSPSLDFFNNHMTAIVRPVKSAYKATAIGGNILYVLDFVLSSGQPEIILILSRDYEFQRFKNFRLTKECLETAAALRQFLQQQVELGTLVCRSFEVIDVTALRIKERDYYKGNPIVASYAGLLKYKVIGRIATLLADRKLRRLNQEAQRRNDAPRIDG